MRQLPESQSLQQRLHGIDLSSDVMLQLVSRLTTFYTRQGACTPVIPWPAFKNLRSHVKTIFTKPLPFVGPFLDKHIFAIVRSATRSFLNRRSTLFENRAKDGWIRDGHGDLRACHIYALPQDDIQIIDCIEFDDRLRRIDVVSDLAFLSMDLDFEDSPHLGSQLMDLYSRLTPDPGAFFNSSLL